MDELHGGNHTPQISARALRITNCALIVKTETVSGHLLCSFRNGINYWMIFRHPEAES